MNRFFSGSQPPTGTGKKGSKKSSSGVDVDLEVEDYASSSGGPPLDRGLPADSGSGDASSSPFMNAAGGAGSGDAAAYAEQLFKMQQRGPHGPGNDQDGDSDEHHGSGGPSGDEPAHPFGFSQACATL